MATKGQCWCVPHCADYFVHFGVHMELSRLHLVTGYPSHPYHNPPISASLHHKTWFAYLGLLSCQHARTTRYLANISGVINLNVHRVAYAPRAIQQRLDFKTHIEKSDIPIKLPGPSRFKDTRQHRQHSTQHVFRHPRHDIVFNT